MLDIKDLTVSYGRTRILNGVSLRLEPGHSLALIGESGAGKTTLGLSIMGLVEGSVDGQVWLGEKNLLALRPGEMRSLRGREVAMVFQNVEDALNPLQQVHSQVMEAMAVHLDGTAPRAAVSTRASRLLEAVGLSEEKAGAYPHQLSGGERQRSLIAMALANDPGVLILDEPTASLDSLTKGDILELLRSATAGKISLVITHDISTAARLCRRMAVMYSGRIVEMGTTEEVLENPRHPYTRGLIRSYPDMKTTKDLQGIPGHISQDLCGCPFHRRCTQHIQVCKTEVPPLQKLEGRWIACHRGGIVPLLQVEGLGKGFGSFQALDGVGFTLHEGETLALVGESGSGKTTLSRIVMGLLQADSGRIILEGEEVRKRGQDFYRRVQMIYQNPKESLSHRMNVLQLVKEPLDVQKVGTEVERRQRVLQALEDVELPVYHEFLECYPHQLSGGMAQRVAIARALVLGPKLLIADEPTSALDASVQAKIMKLLMKLQEDMGLAMLFVTHDIALARKVSDRMAVLHRGRLVEEGPTSELVSNPAQEYTRMLLEQASDLGRRRESQSSAGGWHGRCGAGSGERMERAI
ncbi:MAG: ABC transporter ATP-binding protein [Methanosarcinales archaeon]|nr:ABC transporter ATP-binding protein [Methanosarcinales archaeon]